MLLIILCVILAALYSFLLNLITTNNYYLFLWVPVGIILAIITVVLLILLFLVIAPKDNPTGKFRHKLLYQVTSVAIIFSNIKLTVEGIENQPNETFVVYANHKSQMDPVLIYNASKTICSAVGKKSLFKNPIMKLIADVFGAIPVDRENDREAAKSIVLAIKSVKKGLSMIIFPEGGIKSRDSEEMADLRAGAYKLAMKANAPILPISIIGSSNLSKKSIFSRKNIKLIYHKPIYNEFYKDKTTTEVGTYVEEIINSGVKNG